MGAFHVRCRPDILLPREMPACVTSWLSGESLRRVHPTDIVVSYALWQDTFLDAQHLRDSFPGYDVDIKNNSGGSDAVRPFRITFPPLPPPPNAKAKGKRKVSFGGSAGRALWCALAWHVACRKPFHAYPHSALSSLLPSS